MKFLTTSSIILILTFSSLFSGIDVEEVKEKLALIQNSGNSGKEFLFTIPPIYEEESAGFDNFVKILVTSTFSTDVIVEVPGIGFYKNSKTIENGVIEFELSPTVAQPILHSGRTDKARPARVYKDAAIRVYSKSPVIVYVVAKFKNNSDGFFATPTKYFGTKYINSVYQEPALWESGWFNPFTAVVAAYDNTKIDFTMGGGAEGNDAVPFEDGSLITTGKSKSTIMSKGDVLLLSINGQKQDLSGSLFEGNKPFAIVSGMHCARFPLDIGSCDYAVNMELPTKNWGRTHFVTPQMDRAFNGIVRIYASEPNTDIYRSGAYIGTLEKGGGGSIGESYLELRVWPKFVNEDVRGVPKVATFTSTKPTAIVYYNTSSVEDNDYISGMTRDPFMALIPPIEAAVNNAIVYSPNALGASVPFTENYVRITFPLVNDKIPDDLLVAELSTEITNPKYKKLSQQFDTNHYQFNVKYEGKTYGSKVISVGSEGVYSFKSDSSKFIVESFGASSYETYGFPTAFSLNDYSKPDSIAPHFSFTQQCNGDILKDGGTVTDFPEDDTARSNMAEIFVVAKENYLFDWRRTENYDFIPGEQRELKWWLTVIDKSKPASALIYFSDMAGNDTTIFIEYTLPIYEMEVLSSVNELFNPKLNTIYFQDTIRNLSSTMTLNITRVEIPNQNSPFKITSFEDNWLPGTPIPPLEERYINITFQKDEIKNNNTYSDSLFIGLGYEDDGEISECKFISISELKTSVYFPVYSLRYGNYFGEFNENSKPKKLTETIRNLSTNAPLYISRLEFKHGDKGFSLGVFTPFSWDITKPIAPNSEVVVDIIFNPKSVEQGDEDIELTDSLGIGISVMNVNNELEELEFNFKTQQKAILKAKDLTSVTPEQTLSEYMTVTESSIEILSQALAEGFTELSIFNLDGSKVISTDIQNKNSIAISGLNSGTYIVTLKSESRLLTKKINIVK